MTFVKWTFFLVIAAAYAAVLHYSLPSYDVVRIVGTDVVRMDVSRQTQTGQTETVTRDQMRINTVTPEGRERVYRNDDTDWSFPWYFKFDSADVSARAQNFVSTKEDPSWVVVKHYGWRWPFMSWFPNAISIREATGPDEQVTSWFNITFVTVLTFALIALFRLVQMLIRRNVDPVVEEIEEQRGALRRFWRSIFS
jgi:hypothetical protein